MAELGYRAVASVAAARDCISLLPALQPHVAIVDPQGSVPLTLELVQIIRGVGLPTGLVLLAEAPQPSIVAAVNLLGASALHLHADSVESLKHAIKEVAAGRSLAIQGHAPPVHPMPGTGSRMRPAPGRPLLTGREAELAQLVASGFPNKEIATRLGLTEGTVKIHLHRIYKKLGVTGRMALAAQIRA